MSSIPKVAFIGITSAGKSSAVNAVIGRRECYTGATRTTTAPATFDAIDDAGISFQLVDLPGLADIEDKVGDFDKTAMDTIRTCDIVYWLTDANRAFITQHEMDEFTKIRDFINKIGLDEGIAVQLAILVTKMDREIGTTKPVQKAKTAAPKPQRGEISDDEAESSIVDLYWGVVERFPDIRVAPFNAFGRSYHHAGSSDNLRKHVSKSHLPSKHNIGFSIKHFVGAIDEFRDSVKLKYCFEKVLNSSNITTSKYYCFHDDFKFSCGHSAYVTGCNKCGELEFLTYNGNKIQAMILNNGDATYKSFDPKECQIHMLLNESTSCKFENEPIYWNPFAYKCCIHEERPSNCIDGGYSMLALMIITQSEKLFQEFKNLKLDKSKCEMLKNMVQHNHLCLNDIARQINIPKQDLEEYITQIKSYCRDDNEKFRAIMICKNADIHHLIEIYSKMKYTKCYDIVDIPNKTTVDFIKDELEYPYCDNDLDFSSTPGYDLDDGKDFYVGPIYNMEALTAIFSGDRDLNAIYEINKKNLGTKLYSTRFIAEVKELRKLAFGEAEDDVLGVMLPAAYNEHGLFWRPQ